MNVEGAAVEQHLGRTVMPRYHAGFSFGTVAAAGVAAVAAGLHVPVVVHIPIAVVLSVIGVAFAVRVFLPTADEPEVRHAGDRPAEGCPGCAGGLARAAHAAHRPRGARGGAHRGVRQRLGQPRGGRRVRRDGRGRRDRVRRLRHGDDRDALVRHHAARPVRPRGGPAAVRRAVARRAADLRAGRPAVAGCRRASSPGVPVPPSGSRWA